MKKKIFLTLGVLTVGLVAFNYEDVMFYVYGTLYILLN